MISHCAVDQLPGALALSNVEFEKQYGFPKPGQLDFVIMSCRTNTRAAWAAQIAQDAGLHRTVVYRHGVNGWRLDSSVKVYRGYKLYDQPPEPEAYQIENPDLSVGAAELAALGAVAYKVG
jgi:hypothetical protein